MPRVKAKVIGSGFGGLAAAIRLQAQGFETTLIEKRDKPGGRAYVYEFDGHIFDAGPTVITAPHVLDELFALGGRKTSDFVDLIPVSPFYRLCWEDGYRFDYGSDEKELLQQIEAKSPPDLEGYKEFYRYSQEVFEAGYTELVHVPFLEWKMMLKVAPKLVRLKAYRSVYATVSRFIQNEQLRQALSFHTLLIGGNPYAASSIYVLIHALERKWGVFCVRGGTNVLVKQLVRYFEELGGKVRLNAPVSKIIVENDAVQGVRLEDGEVLGADIVVSNADVNHTYTQLLAGEKRVRKQQRRLGRMSYSQALFVLYFATDKTYPNLAHHSILFGGDYKNTLHTIFKTGKIPRPNSFYLHAPCRSDSSMAPPGRDTFYVLANVPNLEKAEVDWKDYAETYADEVLAYLEKWYMPELTKHVIYRRTLTPLDFKTELNAHLGTAFSLEPTLLQSAYFRVHNRDPQVRGLYFVGAGTHPGAGIPGVINSAKATAQVIHQDWKVADVVSGREWVYGA